MQESMVFYKSFYDAINNVEDVEVRERVYRAIFEYSLLEIEPELEGLSLTLFILIKPQLKANLKRREDGAKGKEYGKLGGRPKKTPMGLLEKTPMGLSSKTPNVNVNENVNVNVNDIESVRDHFNSICTKLPKCQTLTKTRVDLIKETLESFSLDEVKEAFTKANKSDWLTGKTESGWKANFDWLIDINHFARVLEGAYDNHATKKNSFTSGENLHSNYDWDEINKELGITS